MPEGTVKVAFPETGEIVHLSPNGHLVNPATGGEQFAATPEQEALQARAREIAAAAQEPKPAPKARKTTAKKAAPAPAPKEDGDEGYSEAQIKRAQSVHMSAKDCGVDEVLLRDFVRYVTTDDENPEGRTTSTREVTQSEADLLRNIFVGVRDDKIEFRYDDKGHITGVSGISFSPPEEEAPATNGEAKDWKAIATECGLSEARLLRKAREMANEIGVPLPARSAEIGDGELGALLVKWIAEEVNI